MFWVSPPFSFSSHGQSTFIEIKGLYSCLGKSRTKPSNYMRVSITMFPPRVPCCQLRTPTVFNILQALINKLQCLVPSHRGIAYSPRFCSLQQHRLDICADMFSELFANYHGLHSHCPCFTDPCLYYASLCPSLCINCIT